MAKHTAKSVTKVAVKPSKAMAKQKKAVKAVAKPTKAAAPKKAPKKAGAGPDKKPSYKVTNAYIRATITCLDSFDCDKVDKSLPDLKDIGFDFDPERDPSGYHDCNEIDCTYYYLYDAGRNETYDKVYENMYRWYEKHHADFHWFNFVIETDVGIHHSEWYVFRYKNLGIMRRLEDAHKYSSYGRKSEARSLKLGDKERIVNLHDSFLPFSEYSFSEKVKGVLKDAAPSLEERIPHSGESSD